ncbi:MAG: hypothetical protein K2W82_16580 [Candidatus Obscuribacterales bacterium]|nr:hypothetical protein [Candidatus Obscuribacterales bacterium]
MKYLPDLILVCVALACVVYLVRGYLYRRRFNQAFHSEAVKYAVKFWSVRLNDQWDINLSRRVFAENIHFGLVQAYANTGCFPLIGVFFYGPHQYGVDDLLWSAMHGAKIVSGMNRDIDHMKLSSSGRMEISLTRVQFLHNDGPGSFDLWRADGQCPTVPADAGYAPVAC